MDPLRTARGATLVEIIIAILIFGLSLPAVFRGLLLSYNTVKKASQRTSAIAKCQERIEDMKNVGYPNITSANFPADQVTLDNHGTQSTGDDLVATRDVAISNFANPTYKVVTIRVSWATGYKTYNEEMKTIISP